MSYFRFHIYVISYLVCLSVSDFLHLVSSSLDGSMLLQMALFRSFFIAEQYSSVPSIGSQRAGYGWNYLAHACACARARLCVCIPHLLYSFFCWWTSRLLPCVLTIVNSAAMNIEVYGCFQIIIFSRYMPRSGVAGSHFFSWLFLVCFRKGVFESHRFSIQKALLLDQVQHGYKVR